MELEQRNVKAMTFYDICLDFIILDSFKDLDAPPASVTAVVQNRWLSNGFKETVGGKLSFRSRQNVKPYGLLIPGINNSRVVGAEGKETDA